MQVGQHLFVARHCVSDDRTAADKPESAVVFEYGNAGHTINESHSLDSEALSWYYLLRSFYFPQFPEIRDKVHPS